MAARKKTGRQVKAPASKTGAIGLRLGAEDYALYLGRVQASGLSQTDYLKARLIQDRATFTVQPNQVLSLDELRERGRLTAYLKKNKNAASQEKQRLLFLVNKASNNLNQIAHRANADHVAGIIGQKTYERVLADLEQLSRYLKATSRYVD